MWHKQRHETSSDSQTLSVQSGSGVALEWQQVCVLELKERWLHQGLMREPIL